MLLVLGAIEGAYATLPHGSWAADLHITVGDDNMCCRVLAQAPRRATGRLGRFEVIEEEDDAELDEDEEEDGKKGKKKGKKGECGVCCV